MNNSRLRRKKDGFKQPKTKEQTLKGTKPGRLAVYESDFHYRESSRIPMNFSSEEGEKVFSAARAISRSVKKVNR